MTTKIDKSSVVRSYYSGGTIEGAIGILQNDIVRGIIKEVWIDHMYAEHTNHDGWHIKLVYRDGKAGDKADTRTEIAVWNVPLTGEEIESLRRGISPLHIRPKALSSYVAVSPPLLDERPKWKFVARKDGGAFMTYWEAEND